MIATIIPSKRHQKSRFALTVGPLLGVIGGSDPLSWARGDDYELASGGLSGAGKIVSWRVTNCDNEDPGDATAEILNTQSMNTRAKSSRHLHVVIYFPSGENPEEETLHEIEEALVQALGLGDHQRFSVIHVDTNTARVHMHAVISKIHPETHKIISPMWSKTRLMQTCHDIEIKFGLERTNHGIKVAAEGERM